MVVPVKLVQLVFRLHMHSTVTSVHTQRGCVGRLDNVRSSVASSYIQTGHSTAVLACIKMLIYQHRLLVHLVNNNRSVCLMSMSPAKCSWSKDRLMKLNVHARRGFLFFVNVAV